MKRKEYKVFLDNEDIILEIKENELYSIYAIENNGEYQIITSQSINPYIPSPGIKEDPYYIDSMEGPAINTIMVLTSIFNYDELIGRLKYLETVITPEKYNYNNFSMEMAYILEDYLDLLKQLNIETNNYYIDQLNYSKKVVNECFYEKRSDLTNNDFENINKFLNNSISFVKKLLSIN